jgi:hypothetical protein
MGLGRPRPRGRCALQRSGDSPEGFRGRSFGGCCGFLGRGPFFDLGRDHTERVLGLWAYSFVFYYLFERGFSPIIRGPLGLSPTSRASSI